VLGPIHASSLFPVNKNVVPEVGKDILRILAQPYWPYLPSVAEIAERLRIEKIDAEYHVDKLVEKGIVERVCSSINFTTEGRAYVVENKLA
jgi:DNA-binding MarR family transcriptional regulator